MTTRAFSRAVVLFVAIVASAPAFGVREFYSLSRSVRALGMGGAFYGLSDDEQALFYNPAGLSLVRDHRFNVIAVNASFNPDVFSAISDLSGGGQVGQIADKLSRFQGQDLYGGASVGLLSYYRKGFALGLLVPDAKFNFDFLGRDLSTEVDVTGIADAGLVLGWATSFLNDKLHIGVNGKALVRGGGRKLFTLADIAQRNKLDLDPQKLGGVGAGIDFDLGGIYELPIDPVGPLLFTQVGLSINNLLAPTYKLIHITGGNPPGSARTLSLGGHSVFKGVGPIENFHLLLDFAEFSLGGEDNPDFGARGGSFWKHVNLGIEAPFAGGYFTPRLGFHQGYFTAGFGVDVRVVRFDFAWYAEELAAGVNRNPSRRLALRLQIGWGSAPEPIGDRGKKKPEVAPAPAKLEPTPGAPAPEIVQPPPAGAPPATPPAGAAPATPPVNNNAAPTTEGPKPSGQIVPRDMTPVARGNARRRNI